MVLPEETAPAELYYNKTESLKYHRNSRITKIQADLAMRAIELLEIDSETPSILDLGCGSGLSGQALSESGYSWVGLDISPSMLEIAEKETNSSGLICSDMGSLLPFKDESFDFIISISALQWLFQSYKKEHHPLERIKTFFRSIYNIVRKRAVIQFYCEKKATEILKREALKAGFTGGLRIDGEGTKECKMFLVLNKNHTPIGDNTSSRKRVRRIDTNKKRSFKTR